MRKALYVLSALSLFIGFTSCSSDDDESYFRVKDAIEEGTLSIKVYLDNDVTTTTLNIESNINSWSLVKKDTRQIYWSFDEDLTKPNKIREIKGSGNKEVTIYLVRNPNKQDRSAHIEVYYGGKTKRTIQITQKGIGDSN